jgi:hypothetical protein
VDVLWNFIDRNGLPSIVVQRSEAVAECAEKRSEHGRVRENALEYYTSMNIFLPFFLAISKII